MSYGVNFPQGLKPVEALGVELQQCVQRTFNIKGDGTNAAMYEYTPVDLTGGYLVVATGGTGNPLIGSAANYSWTDSNNNSYQQNWLPAAVTTKTGTTITALVYCDPRIIYTIQCIGAGIAQTNVGANGNLITGAVFAAGGVGSQSTAGFSGAAMSSTFVTGTADSQLKIMGVDAGSSYAPQQFGFDPGSIAFGVQYNNALVMINNHRFNSGTGTVGV